MASAQKDPVLVVLQLTGGNDYLNTVIPYNNPLYQDNRKAVGIPESQILAFDNEFGFPPYLAPLKKIWDENKLAIMHGVGYLDSPRSHFRSMDIWHTCEADKVGTEGWLGRVIREFDPNKENVVTAVSFGPCLFRALAVPGVPVACVAGSLERYGFLPNIQEPTQRLQVLERFSRMYQPIEGSGVIEGSAVMDYLGTTGLDSLKGADILKVGGIAQVHLANLGTRVFYCDHGSFDSHAGQNPLHAKLWTDVSEGLDAFMTDLRQHDASENVIVLMFSEFGRRVRDNGSGTDHGAAGATFVLGDRVKGGNYGEFPSMKAEHLVQGDLNPSMDFRGIYSTILDKWLKVNPVPIVNGTYEQPAFLQ
jgi:uncharacterized protein (DUF1501 family)